MTRVFAFLGRFAMMLAGYAAASLAASAFLHVVVLAPLGWSPDEAVQVAAGSFVISIPFIALFVAYFAFVPAIAAMLLGEVLGQRDWLYYALAGAAVAGVVIGLFWYSTPQPIDFGDGAATAADKEPLRNPTVLLALVAAGMTGGLAYWLVAGRGAGAVTRAPGNGSNPSDPTSPGP